MALLAFGVVAGALMLLYAALPSSAAGPFENPHGPYGVAAEECAACHRLHSADGRELLGTPESQSTLCLSCHDGTGASSNVAAEFNDPNVPPNSAPASAFYSHPAVNDTDHVSAQIDEFAGVLNRHSACTDCHNPHSISPAFASQTNSGWTASGAISGSTGVSASLSWKTPLSYEYELCLKCHSRYTQLLSYAKESYKKMDKAAEFDPSGASYHPVEAPGRNATSQLQESLNGGRLWRFSVGSTIRCTNCHGNYQLVGNPPSQDSPPADARLAPHASAYRGLLIANYRDRDLKPRNEPYQPSDFALCYLCHSEAPFTSSEGARPDTNFKYHGKHVSRIGGEGGGSSSLDIDVAGAGQGNAICAECHFRVHGTALAPWPQNQNYSRGVNFAPNVQPLPGQPAPQWSVTDRSCSLICHGKTHNPKRY